MIGRDGGLPCGPCRSSLPLHARAAQRHGVAPLGIHVEGTAALVARRGVGDRHDPWDGRDESAELRAEVEAGELLVSDTAAALAVVWRRSKRSAQTEAAPIAEGRFLHPF